MSVCLDKNCTEGQHRGRGGYSIWRIRLSVGGSFDALRESRYCLNPDLVDRFKGADTN